MNLHDTDDDGRKEPLFEEVDEASNFAEGIGLEGGVHPQEKDDETMWAPGDSPSELDRAQERGDVMDKISEAKEETKEELGTDDDMRL